MNEVPYNNTAVAALGLYDALLYFDYVVPLTFAYELSKRKSYETDLSVAYVGKAISEQLPPQFRNPEFDAGERHLADAEAPRRYRS